MPQANLFHPGAILTAVWGYDQTNVNYYQVLKRTEKTVTVQESRPEYDADDNLLPPTKNQFHGDILRRKIKDGYITINPVQDASPYDGKTCHPDPLASR